MPTSPFSRAGRKHALKTSGLRLMPKNLLKIENLSEFYLSPYLTCKECNGIQFINSVTVQRALVTQESRIPGTDDVELSYGLRMESLPKCPGCGRTHTWIVGAHDLAGDIFASALEREKRKEVERVAGTKLQAWVRGYKDRRRAVELKRLRDEYNALVFRSSSMMAAVYRGRLDRRAARVERDLKRIRATHRTVMREALRKQRGQPVFWYKRKVELELLYTNYRLLVQRTGNYPPLHRVEANIARIAERIHKIECRYASTIQKRVRGLIGRKFIRQYRIEQAHVRAVRSNACFHIQRAYHAWIGRNLWKAQRKRVRRRELLQRYREEKQEELYCKERESQMIKLRREYAVERAEENAAKLSGKVAYTRERGKLAAFKASPYGHHKVDASSIAFLNSEIAQLNKLGSARMNLASNQQRMEDKIKSNPGFSGYYKKELSAGKSTFMKELEKYKLFRRPKTLQTGKYTPYASVVKSAPCRSDNAKRDEAKVSEGKVEAKSAY